MIPPPGYHVVKEEDKNVDFGPEYIPEAFYQTGNTFGDGGAERCEPAAGDRDRRRPRTSARRSASAPRTRCPDTLALFPGVQTGAWAGATTPLCDEKLVRVSTGGNTGVELLPPDRVARRGPARRLRARRPVERGAIPNSPQFGEKYAPPFLPVSIRDWTGTEINHVYTDRFGNYNAMVPSMYDIAPPIPSGVTPNILQVCINSPTTTFDVATGQPLGATVPDPWYDKRYTQFCYTTFYMPGTTTYLDTPVTPTSSFTGPQNATVDVEAPDQTPVIKTVFQGTRPAGRPDRTSCCRPSLPTARHDVGRRKRTITITSMGTEQVPNPVFRGWANCPPSSTTCTNGVESTVQRIITRDHGFGATTGHVYLDTLDYVSNDGVHTGKVLSSTELTEGLTWSNDTITVRVPNAQAIGEIRVVRSGVRRADPVRTARGVTLTVVSNAVDAAMPPVRVPADQPTIQAAVNAAPSGGLVLVAPGTYQEEVVMAHPVRLQGWGAPATIINAAKSPTDELQKWRTSIAISNGVTTQPGGVAALRGQQPELPAVVPAGGAGARQRRGRRAPVADSRRRGGGRHGACATNPLSALPPVFSGDPLQHGHGRRRCQGAGQRSSTAWRTCPTRSSAQSCRGRGSTGSRSPARTRMPASTSTRTRATSS